MKKLLVFPFLFCFAGGHSQNKKIDSLFYAFKSAKEDTTKVITLVGLSRSFYVAGNYDSSMYYAAEAKKRALNIGYDRGIAASLVNIANIFRSEGNYPDALVNYIASLKLYQKIGDKQNMGVCYAGMGVIYRRQSNYPEALKNFHAAKEIFEISGDKMKIANLHTSIGNVYYSQLNYDKALQSQMAALKLQKELGNKGGEAACYNNIGNIYDMQQNYSEAIKNNLAALKLQDAIGDKNGLSISTGNLCAGYYQSKDYANAEKYGIRATTLARQLGNLEGIASVNKCLSEMYAATGRYKEALSVYKEYNIAEDSMYNEENTKKIVEEQMNYEFEIKQAAIRAEQEKKDAVAAEEKKRGFYISLGLGLLVLFTVLIAWLVLRQNKLRAKQQATQLEQKLLRTQMNPHFIFNSLTAIESYIYSNQPREAGKYLAGFARLMRMILENSREESITLEKEIKTLEHYLQLQKLRYEDKFDYKISVDESIDVENTLIPPMLAQPAIENSIEHGIKYLESTKGQIDVSFIKKDNELVLEIRDNGVGLQKSLVLESGSKAHTPLATTITQERIKMLNKGKANKIRIRIEEIKDAIDNICGTRTLFTMPYREA